MFVINDMNQQLKYILQRLNSIKPISGWCEYFPQMSACNSINQTVTADCKVHRYG